MGTSLSGFYHSISPRDPNPDLSRIPGANGSNRFHSKGGEIQNDAARVNDFETGAREI